MNIDPLPTPRLAIGYRKSESVGGVRFARKHTGGTKYTFHCIGLQGIRDTPGKKLHKVFGR